MSIKINVPQAQHFIHKCYIECSKELYKNIYIFDLSKNLTPKEKHSNLRESINIINHSISNAIRDLLPIRDILKQGLIQQTMPHEQDEISKEEISFKEKDDESVSQSTNDEFEGEHNNENNEDNQYNENDEKNDENNEELNYNNNEDEDSSEDEVNDNNEFNSEKLVMNENNENNTNVINNENNDEIKEINLNHNENKLIENSPEKDINFLENNNSSIPNFNNLNNHSNELKETKEITLGNNTILKKIENVEKVKENNDITELLKPVNIKPNISKLHNKNLIKNKIFGGDKTNSFYQKKYDEHLANYNYTSESYLDEEDSNGIGKNQLNLNYNSSDDEDNNPIELV